MVGSGQAATMRWWLSSSELPIKDWHTGCLDSRELYFISRGWKSKIWDVSRRDFIWTPLLGLWVRSSHVDGAFSCPLLTTQMSGRSTCLSLSLAHISLFISFDTILNQMWWCTPSVLALLGKRQVYLWVQHQLASPSRLKAAQWDPKRNRRQNYLTYNTSLKTVCKYTYVFGLYG